MITARTAAQYVAMYAPSKRIYEATMEFLEQAGAKRLPMPKDGSTEEVEWAGITLCIGGGAMYAINEGATAIDNLLDKKCKLDVLYRRKIKTTIYKGGNKR